MKKLLIILLILGTIFCSKKDSVNLEESASKNPFEEAVKEIEEIISEEKKLLMEIKKNQEEVASISTEKISDLSDKFKNKYENNEIEAENELQTYCLDILKGFGSEVDKVLQLYKKRIGTKGMVTKSTGTELESGINGHETMLKICKGSIEKNKIKKD